MTGVSSANDARWYAELGLRLEHCPYFQCRLTLLHLPEAPAEMVALCQTLGLSRRIPNIRLHPK